jgi:hypothetical protein
VNITHLWRLQIVAARLLRRAADRIDINTTLSR